MGKVAFVFPGQGSQKVGMGKALAEASPAARAVFDSVDEALGQKISTLCFEGPEADLKLTANTQPCILAMSAAATAALAERGVVADLAAGHSLGEYSALVCAGAITAGAAARVVRSRGVYMQEAVPPGQGAMSAVLGLDPQKVRELCAQAAAATGQVVSPANYNDPGQTVIAGDAAAVEAAGVLLKEAGASRVMPLPVSAPFHCALMEPVKARFEPVLREVAWRPLRIPVVTNVEALPNADVERVPALLLAQITSPVRWIECVQELVRHGVSHVVEVGPGKVLNSALKRIDKSVVGLQVDDVASLEKTVSALQEAR